MRDRQLRAGPGEPLRRAVRSAGGAVRGRRIRGAVRRGTRGTAAAVRRRPSRGVALGDPRHGGVRLHGVPDGRRALRAARGLPLVRGLGGDHDDRVAAVRRGAARDALGDGAEPLVFTAMTSAMQPVVPQQPHGRYLVTLALTALGVVYGDIGTSPLYAIRYSFYGPHGIAVTPGNVLGVLSLVFWALVIVVTIKYHIVIIRADNKGEGGVLALMALVNGSRLARGLSPRRLMIVLGIFGSALLYADGGLTPALSVLSAVEGVEIATPQLQHWVIWITLAILIGLFMFQSRGTAGVGAVFGPVMLVWFATIAVLGLNGILKHPAVVSAVLPTHAIRFLADDPGRGLLVLGAVFLVVTGGEALYADLGHFGHTAIQLAWFTIPLPALMLNYFGQGALLLTNPAAAANPFYLLAPAKLLLPLIPLATLAAIIASQAVISGAFSLTRQAVQLGYIPRMDIEHTSSREIGQIYVPSVNWLL